MRRPVALVRQRGACHRIRQRAVHAATERSQRRPDAPGARFAVGHDGFSVHAPDAAFPGAGRAALRARHGADGGHGRRTCCAPRWHRFGRWLFDSGESFYNFRGLRSFKDKFHPVWEPRYLAAPQGVATLLSLADVTALIAGGLRGVIAK